MHTSIRIVVGLTLVFPPWAFGTTEPWSLRTLEVLCFLSAVLLIIQQAIRRGPPVAGVCRPVIFIFGILVLLLIGAQLLNPVHIKTVARGSVYELVGGNLSLPHTVRWTATIEAGLRWLGFFLFGFALFQSIQTRDDITFVLRVLVLNAALVSVEGILQNLSGSNELLGFRKPSHGGQIFGPFVCRNNFTSYANLCLPIAIGMALLPDILPRRETSSAPERFFWGFCAAILFAAVVLSSSRAGVFLSFVVAGAMIVDFAFRRRRRGSSGQSDKGRSMFVMLLVFGLVVLVGGALQVLERFQQTDLTEPVRMDIWEALWSATTESPWWGYGLGTFQYLFPYYQPVENPWYYEYAHNDWLEALFDLGGIGFALLALLVISVMAVIARERILKTSAFRRSVASCALISLLGCLVHALVDFPLQIAAVQITFVTIAAMGLSLRFVSERNA